jgi:hypothetical protein
MKRDCQDQEEEMNDSASDAFIFHPACYFNPDHLCPSLLVFFFHPCGLPPSSLLSRRFDQADRRVFKCL